MFLFAAEEVATKVASNTWSPVMVKGLMMCIGMMLPAFAIGWIGSSVMKAVGRNPESGKYIGQIIVMAAMVELMALLTFGAVFVIK
jgi:F0F1-type ATP synthase membrane subunit c/vacuolar-type H+-ATPase subunit K